MLGQGQRFIEEEDISKFREEAERYNNEHPRERLSFSTFGATGKAGSYWFPEGTLDIIKYAIYFTQFVKRELVTRRGYRVLGHPYGRGFNNFYYIIRGYGGDPTERIFDAISLTNYPLILSMLDQGFGRTASISYPELHITEEMVAIMEISKNFSPERVLEILLQLEGGEHIKITPTYDPVNQQKDFFEEYRVVTPVGIDWLKGTCRGLLGG